MDKLYKNRYRTTSARAAWWSYGWPGAYFITICTKKRRHFFGEIINYKMYLSPIGELAMNFWCEIPNHAHDVELGAFQVMPNHFHGIIILNGTTSDSNSKTGSNRELLTVDNQMQESTNVVKNGLFVETDNAAVNDPVETRRALSLLPPGPGPRETVCKTNADINPDSRKKPPPQTQSCLRYQNQGTNTVSSIIGGYKSAVTRDAHLIKSTFQWQSGFHDHIIRNDLEYQRINDYIEDNPQKWREDRFITRFSIV